MQQKVQFITAVIHDPDLLILDEPFSGLDPVNVELMKQTILEKKAEGRTIILSTHQMEIAEKLCDDVCMINRSHKVLDGKLREIRRSFSRNAVELQITEAMSVLEDPSLVANIRESGDDLEVLLAPGADAQTLLKRLVASGAVINKFELAEPSLHDIFIAKVREIMRKFFAVIKREYLQRVRTKFFIVATVLGPVLLALFTVVPVYIASINVGNATRLAVIDQTGKIYDRFREALAYTEDDDDVDSNSNSGASREREPTGSRTAHL